MDQTKPNSFRLFVSKEMRGSLTPIDRIHISLVLLPRFLRKTLPLIFSRIKYKISYILHHSPLRILHYILLTFKQVFIFVIHHFIPLTNITYIIVKIIYVIVLTQMQLYIIQQTCKLKLYFY